MLLSDQLKSKNIILATGSPRRHSIMSEAGLIFTVAPRFSIDENFPPELNPYSVAEYLSIQKSTAYTSSHGPYANGLRDNDILITADTTVICDSKILGKPSSPEEAIHMLSLLSDRAHDVVSGVSIRTCSRIDTFSQTTRVFFDSLSPEDITYYVNKYSPLDKAGSYGIQEWIGHIGISRIEGSFYNVMGLPIQLLCQHLRSF